MIDRGWRRSGRYIYKPNLRDTCCPQYTIRADALQLHVGKNGKRAIKKLHEHVNASVTKSTKDNKPFDLTERMEALESPSSKLKVDLVKADFRKDAFDLWKKYQRAIHNDSDSKLTKDSYIRFLCQSPLEYEESIAGSPDYGSYHQHYRVDGTLVAVGVVDILPYCVSSVYLIYDPAWADYQLGKITAYREAVLTRQLYSAGLTELKWYCMGFYIHSCQKMRYKGEYGPAFLLDRDTYEYVEIEKCIRLLNDNEHTSFIRSTMKNGKSTKQDDVEMDSVSTAESDSSEEVASEEYPSPPPPGMLDPSTITNTDISTVWIMINGQVGPGGFFRSFIASEERLIFARELVAALGKEMILNNEKLWLLMG